MLDFSKVLKQIQDVKIDSLREIPLSQVLDSARTAYGEAASDARRLKDRLSENAPWVFWPVATPLEPFGVERLLPAAPDTVTVIAVDGSQIMPSHHEVHNCYLLNAGIAVISYGENASSLLESLPRLHHRPEDLYPLVDRRRVHIDELFVSLERFLFELEALMEYALNAKSSGAPIVALADGSLIPWSLDKMPIGYQESFFQRMQSSMQKLQEAGIPLMAYISHSRSSEMINMLRTFICPYDLSNCREYCSNLNEEDFPCSRIWPLTDRQLLAGQLPGNFRSSICLTAQTVSRALDANQQICFSYINFGSEIARIEFPRWVADNGSILDLGLGALAAQVTKGGGYPVSLAEAHHLAVIKGKDREQFFELIARHLSNLGVNRIQVSPKESKKRIGFV